MSKMIPGADSSMAKSMRSGIDFPLVDLHAHLEGDLSLERAVQLAQERDVKLGIVEHGGRGQEIGDDDALMRYVESLEAYPVHKGMQAEGLDWMVCFSKEAISRLDYILSDALTFPEKGGRLVQLWQPQVRIENAQDFMDRYVDFNVLVITSEPIDILANPTFLPACIADRYDELWPRERMEKVIEAAIQHDVAIEINSRYNIPSAAFVRMARVAGVRFSFGSNQHGEDVGKLEYCLRMAKECELTRQDMFVPGE